MRLSLSRVVHADSSDADRARRPAAIGWRPGQCRSRPGGRSASGRSTGGAAGGGGAGGRGAGPGEHQGVLALEEAVAADAAGGAALGGVLARTA